MNLLSTDKKGFLHVKLTKTVQGPLYFIDKKKIWLLINIYLIIFASLSQQIEVVTSLNFRQEITRLLNVK